MTFQPPPPPPGGTPPPPPPSGPPGQWGPPSGGGGYPQGGGSGFDPKSVNPLDWGILGAGVLAFIFSLFDYYDISVSYRGIDGGDFTYSAWHGFFGWFAALAALVGAALVAAAIFAPQVKLPVPARLAGLIAFAVATLCVILALFIIPDGDVGDIPGVDDGHGFGYWASLVLIIAGLVLSLMRFQQSGGQLPGGLSSKVPNIGQHGPQGGLGSGSQGQYGSAPQPGYGSAPQPGYGSAPQPGYGSAPQPGTGTPPPPPPPPGYGPPAGQ